MTVALDRRGFVAASLAQAMAFALGGSAHGQAGAGHDGLVLGQAQPFSFDALKARAKDLAGQPHVAPPRPAPDVVAKIDYAIHGTLKYRTDVALFAKGPGQFPATFFHLGQFFQKSVRMHVVDNGQQREIVYEPAYFDMPPNSIARHLPENAGFAGFRLQENRAGHPSRGGRDGGKLEWRLNDWVAFLGASYFRAIGEDYQYGLSARGLAIDPAIPGTVEEFPDFTSFYIETPADESATVIVYALLDGPSVTGAYRFAMTRTSGVVMDVGCQLHVRRDVQRFCISPLTSMYWFSETIKNATRDWRPEVHDSDGLALWTGTGERIWRPLNNPPRQVVSSFFDDNPKGFGLMQRDRNYDHYHDGVGYERRPSLWIEPIGQWGRGAVQLMELPTDDEIHDNIVAAWVPAEPVQAGRVLDLDYKLHWLNDEPSPVRDQAQLARTVATRIGTGGEPGTLRPAGLKKFVVEFSGATLANIPPGIKPEAVVTTSRGEIVNPFTEALSNDVAGHWRAVFDLKAGSGDPVELRMFMRLEDQVLTETWAYQYHV
jgi:periplasmic glucans biosynthesis protein